MAGINLFMPTSNFLHVKMIPETGISGQAIKGALIKYAGFTADWAFFIKLGCLFRLAFP
jgi:hypothetical protein